MDLSYSSQKHKNPHDVWLDSGIFHFLERNQCRGSKLNQEIRFSKLSGDGLNIHALQFKLFLSEKKIEEYTL